MKKSQNRFLEYLFNPYNRGFKMLFFLCLLFSFAGNYTMAQAAPAASGGIGLLYYFLIAVVVFISIYVYYVLQKVSHAFVELGLPPFELNFTMFRSFTQNSKIVSIVIALIVLAGIFFVVTYGA